MKKFSLTVLFLCRIVNSGNAIDPNKLQAITQTLLPCYTFGKILTQPLPKRTIPDIAVAEKSCNVADLPALEKFNDFS